MASSSSAAKRPLMEMQKLLEHDFVVELVNNNTRELRVLFHGPKDSLYEGGVWKVHVYLPEEYPYDSPSVGFETKIYHPNVEEASGTICLNVLSQEWSPVCDLLTVFDTFLPQLLLYPNPKDPFNIDAATLMLSNRAAYDQKVIEYCERYAKPELPVDNPSDNEEPSGDETETSD